MGSNPQKVATAREAGTLSRPIFFTGQLMTADDFRAEQNYCIGLSRLTARAALGYGIISGLGVQVKAEDGEIVVSPGIAVDRLGNIIELSREARLGLPGAGSGHRELLIVLRRIEELTEYRPSAGAGEGEDAFSMATRADSIVELALETGLADPITDGIRNRRDPPTPRRLASVRSRASGEPVGWPSQKQNSILWLALALALGIAPVGARPPWARTCAGSKRQSTALRSVTSAHRPRTNRASILGP